MTPSVICVYSICLPFLCLVEPSFHLGNIERWRWRVELKLFFRVDWNTEREFHRIIFNYDLQIFLKIYWKFRLIIFILIFYQVETYFLFIEYIAALLIIREIWHNNSYFSNKHVDCMNMWQNKALRAYSLLRDLKNLFLNKPFLIVTYNIIRQIHHRQT